MPKNADIAQVGGNPQYNGPAPEPKQLDLGLAQSTETLTVQPNQLPDPGIAHPIGDAPPIMPQNQNPLAPRGPQVQSSPPPAAPESAAQVSALQQQVGALINRIGELESQHARERAEDRLNFQTAMAASAANAGPPEIALPANTGPDDSVTYGDMQRIMGGLPGLVTSTALRATWDVSPDEEAAVIAANPALQNIPEPQRTQLIKQAVQLRRPQATSAPAAVQAQVPQAPSAPSRPVQQTVADVETPLAPQVVSEPAAPQSVAAQAMAEYENAKRIPDKKARHRAMKAAWNKSLAAAGVSHDQLSHSSFKVS